MLPYPAIDPVAVSFGPVRLHWYGVMYIAAFLAAWLLGRCRAARPGSGWTADQVDDLATWAMLGVVLGARLGYILFYDLDTYLADPLEVFRVWNGGMSFHGGLVGVLSAALWWSLRHKKRFLDVTDFVAPLVPPGLFFGRLGNFINGELWGKATPPSFTRPDWKDCCCSRYYGYIPANRVLWARYRACSPCSMPCAASGWNFSACPILNWVTCFSVG